VDKPIKEKVRKKQTGQKRLGQIIVGLSPLSIVGLSPLSICGIIGGLSPLSIVGLSPLFPLSVYSTYILEKCIRHNIRLT